MKIIRIKILVCLFLVLASCKKPEEESNFAGHIGTWKFMSMTCNSTVFKPSGWDEFFTLNDGNGYLTDIGQGCYSSQNNFAVTKGESTVYFSGGLSACSPSNCSMQITMAYSGGSESQGYSCVAGKSATQSTEYFIDANGYLSVTSGSCNLKYKKVSITIPNASCITESRTSLITPETMGFHITADNTDKAGFRFGVTAQKKLSTLTLKMTSPNLTSVTVRIYSGGNQPEEGTLIATSVLEDQLLKTSLAYHTFYFSENPTLEAGQAYFITIQGKNPSSTGTFDVVMNNSTAIPQAQSWGYSPGWVLQGTHSPNMSLGLSDPGCQ